MASLPMPLAPRSRLAEVLVDRSVQDGAFAALIVLSRIPANLGTGGAALGLLLICLYTALRQGQAIQALWRGRWQLIFPLFALISIAWAVYPEVTARAAIQMTITAFAGLLLSQSAKPRAVLIGLFVAYAGYTMVSFAVGHTRPDGLDAFPALFGLGGEAKNYFADSAGTGALLAMTMAAACLERRARLGAWACGGIALVCALANQRAHSAGAVTALAVSGTLLCILLFLRMRAPFLKLAFSSALLAVALVCLLCFQPLLAMVQEFSAKDAGLTGRGYLWYRAQFIVDERPWFGLGYFGFWTPSNPDAVGLWRYFDVRQEGTAFSFHNSYIQTIVETGYVGVTIMVGCWVVGVLTLLRRFVLAPSLATCFWLSYLALELSKSPVEPIRPAALVAPTIMLFMALGFGTFPISGRSVFRRSQSALILPVDREQ